LKPTKKIWLDGKYVQWNDAKIHVLTHGLHYGYALFEGIRCNDTPDGPAIFRLEEHVDRLINGAKIYRMQLPYSKKELMDTCVGLVRQNGLKNYYIRPIFFGAYGELGVNPLKNKISGAVACWEWGAYLGEEGMEKGIRCTISSWTRIDSKMIPPHAKCSANYANSILAKMDALAAGYDEAILLSSNGMVAEGSGENIFRVNDGIVTTPTKAAGILEGITRDSVIHIARDMNILVHESDFTREDVFTSDELFFSGTAANVTPIKEVDNRKIGNGQYPITKKIQKTYLDAIHGRLERYKNWLTYVR
jgi:branched-chain amino acid aminotransferase